MRIDLSCPVENRGMTVKTSSKNNESYALFRLFNLSDKVIKDISYEAKAYDAYGKELGSIPVTLSDVDGQPRSFFALNKAVSLAGYEEAKHVVIEFTQITFEDEDIYIPEEYMEVTIPEPDYGDQMLLSHVAGEDATCFAQDPGTHWLCVCGRPNKESDDICIRCHREKDMVMEKYSSRERLNKAAQELEAQLERERLDNELKLEQEKEEKRKKTFKTAYMSLITLVCVAILGTIGYFTYGFVVTKIADGKVESGDYLAAYKLYNQIGSKHIGKASEYVRGNSPSNLINSGILTSDDENLYFINAEMNLFKENKESGERVQLGQGKGVFLNIVGDYLYFINTDDQQKIYRVSTDGTVTEKLTDETAYNLSVLGNDIYYIAAEEVASADPSQPGQPMPVLYTLKVGDKKPKKITDEYMQSYLPYKDKIYFVHETDNSSIYSMNKNGSEVTKVVAGPAPVFEIVNDVIYYLDYTVSDEVTGIPNLSLNKCQLDGTYIGPAIQDVQVMQFVIEKDTVYFSDYAQNMIIYKQNLEGGEKELVTEEPLNLFNISDDTILYIDNMGQLVKNSIDGNKMESLGSLQ